MTFSVAAACPDSGQFGVIVTSSSICVASRCAFVRQGIGAALSQNITDPELGPLMLDRCQHQSAADVIADLGKNQQHIEYRQLALVDKDLGTACFTGDQALGVTGEASGKGCVAVGNLLANSQVPRAMIDAFEASRGSLASRLLTALAAGQQQGGEAGPIQSAGLRVIADASWPVVDLRVDWHDQPIAELQRLWGLYEPQMNDYRVRAADPRVAPSYGVPGDP